MKVNVTPLGGGFGRKSKPDYCVEAALCAKAAGKPVKLVWTRQDDIHHGYYHTVSAEHLEAGLDEKGMPVAWLHRSAAPTIGSIFAAGANHEMPFELGMGLVNLPYAIPNVRMENPAVDAHVRIGWFQSVSNIPHAFAVQSFVAECAAAVGRDPKDYLLDVIGPARVLDPVALGDAWNHGEDPKLYPIDTGRLRNVIDVAAKAIGWGRTMPRGSGLGIAGHYSFVTYTSVACEVAVDDKGKVVVKRVDIAIDCGPVVNPERVRSQLEGAVVMGMGLSLMSKITFKGGKAVQSNFDSYEILRIDAAPKTITVHIVQHDDWHMPSAASASPACHRLRRRLLTRSSPPPVVAFANCRSEIMRRAHKASGSVRHSIRGLESKMGNEPRPGDLGDVIDMVGGRFELVARMGTGGDDAVLFRTQMAARKLVPLHSHIDPECLYVSSGAIEVFLLDEAPMWHTVASGRSLLVANGIKHAIRNSSDQPADLVLATNNRFAAFCERPDDLSRRVRVSVHRLPKTFSAWFRWRVSSVIKTHHETKAM